MNTVQQLRFVAFVCALAATSIGAAQANDDAWVTRFKAASSGLDTTFGTQGWVRSGFADDDVWYDHFFDLDGKKIIATGYFVANNASQMIVARFKEHGQVDSFGYGGVTTAQHPDALASSGIGGGVDSQGRIVVLSNAVTPGFAAFSYLTRFLPNGTRDLTYGTNGFVKLTHTNAELLIGLRLVVEPNGKATLLAWSEVDGWVLKRYTHKGARDLFFSTNVRVGIAQARALARDSVTGKLVVAGSNAADSRWQVTRFDAQGLLDEDFGVAGLREINFPNSNVEQVYNALLDPSGRTVIAGTAQINGKNVMAVSRLSANGALDTGFGGSTHQGRIKLNIPDADGLYARDIARDVDGRIVLVGDADFSTPVARFLVAARLLDSGAPDPQWSSNGLQMITFLPDHVQASSVIIDGSKRPSVAGVLSPTP